MAHAIIGTATSGHQPLLDTYGLDEYVTIVISRDVQYRNPHRRVDRISSINSLRIPAGR